MFRERPNILLFISDQQRWQTVCGRSRVRTPHMDRLGREGMRFDRSYATVALSCPARAALLSGQFPWHNGVLNQVHMPERTGSDLYPGVDTYSQRLRKAGYRLGYVGKWHASWDRLPIDFGFNDARSLSGFNPLLPQYADVNTDGSMSTPPGDGRRRLADVECSVSWPGAWPYPFYGIDHGPEESTGAHTTTSAAIDLIKLYRGASLWFIAVNVEPHDPYVPLARYAADYDPVDVELPLSWHDDFVGKPNLNRREAGLWASLSKGQVRTAIARYGSTCAQVDAQVSRAPDALTHSDQAENILVVFTSNHGNMMGARRQFIKGWQPYEETYRVPLVMRWPGVITPSGVCHRLVELHDLAHTFVEITHVGQIIPEDGRSLVPLLDDPHCDGWDNVAFCAYYGGEFLYTQRMVITPRYKYVFNGWDFDELYDLQEDPYEMRNAVDDVGYRRECDTLRTLLYERMDQHGDPYARNRYGAPRYLPRPGGARRGCRGHSVGHDGQPVASVIPSGVERGARPGLPVSTMV